MDLGISMCLLTAKRPPTGFDATVKTLLDDVESRHTVLADADLTVTLDTGDVDNVATQAAINFSRTLRYLLKNLTADSARSILHGRRGTS